MTGLNARIGQYLKGRTPQEEYLAYVPPPLPPDPPLDVYPLLPLLDAANQGIGRLDAISTILPDPSLFIYMYVRKEALLSSQIEGTQSSLSDLLLHESGERPGVPLDDVQEVSSYVSAMNYGLDRLRADFPLSLRLLREIHARLLSNGRGSDKTPGEFRTTQNWIGGSRPGNAMYVPPPASHVIDCLGELEKFLHAETNLPVLIRAALAHVQFETIHPFLDGNGRLGRLLITFLLCARGVLRDPTLYLSLYFKTHRSEYYDLLQRVRTTGDWETWIEFFLRGVVEVANQAHDAARQIHALFHRDRVQIESLSRIAPTALRLHMHLQRYPLASVPSVASALKLSFPPVQKAMEQMIKLGIVREITGRQTKRLYAYTAYVNILSEGTEPIRTPA